MMDTAHGHAQSDTTDVNAANQIAFGGKGGGFTPVGDVGGKQILFWSGVRIDAIQIGESKFGGSGGTLAGSAKIPEDGKVYLIELQASDSELCYIRMKIGDTDIAVGDKSHSGAVVLNLPNLAVKFAGISSGTMVDKLYFNIG